MRKNTYKNPTLIEAVFELRFPPNDKWGMGSVVSFANLADKEGFPEVVDSPEGFQINFGSGKNPPEFRPASRRVQTWNLEKTELWQASSELFAANRRAPYQGWDEFYPHILKGLDIYQRIAKQKTANHLALQYVNRIEYSRENDLSDFLTFMPPQIEFADLVKSAACTAQYQYQDGDLITVNAGLNLDVPKRPAMILNINYSSPEPALVQSKLKKKIELAHQRLIDAFEKSITDQQRERMVLK